METRTIKKVCPPPSELSGIKKNIPCPEEGCNSTFLNSSNLDMHLSKHHKRTNIDLLKKGKTQTVFQYHCPVEKCLYNLKAERFFKTMKYLKQHYLKVHAEKTYQCEKCHKGFSTETVQRKHTRTCGMKFTCSCGFSYESYEALLTHAKRHQHAFDEKFRFYGKMALTTPETEVSNGDNQRTITVPVHTIATVAVTEIPTRLSTTVDKGIQTDKFIDSKRNRKNNNFTKASRRKTSAQTQTGSILRNRHPTISAETQTIGDYILKKAMKDADIPVIHKDTSVSSSDLKVGITAKKRRKSMETQTSQSLANNTSNGYLYLNAMDRADNIISQNQNVKSGKKSSHKVGSNVSFSHLTQCSPPSSFSLFSNSDPFTIDIDSFTDFWPKNSSATQTSPVNMTNFMVQGEMFSNSVTQTDINNVLFETAPYPNNNSNINSSSQTIDQLHDYFEDSANPGFEARVATSGVGLSADVGCSSPHVGSIHDGTTVTVESTYSNDNLESMLTQSAQLFDESWSCSTETQTELDFNSCFFNDDETSFTHYFNTETQTTEDTDTLDQLLYSNTYTQTSEAAMLSGFADIQTQTGSSQFNKDSVFVSIETQTQLSTCHENPSSSTEKLWLSYSKTATVTSQTEVQSNNSEFRDFITDLVKRDTNDKLL